MTHTNNHSETLTTAIQLRTIETPSAQLRHPRSCFAEANQQSGFAGKLLAVAAAIAVFSAALAWPFSSQRLEAQTIEASPEPVIHATGQQSLSSVPSDAIRLFYNCTEEGEESSLVRHSYVRVFSSRNISSCSGYEEGDYILRAVIDGRFPGLYYPSGTFRFNVRFETYIVGSVPWASEGDARVEDFDYYIDGARHSVSALGCGTNLVSRSLSFTSSVFETTLLCNSVYWERVLARHWIVPGENTAIHILPPEFTEWPLPNVQVIRLEVTQGVQDWNNDLTLVRNRRTVVRAFMETALGRKRELTAQLQGQKFSANGRVLFIETTDPVNSGQSVTVMPNVVERRGNIDASLNFILPAHWTDLEENEELLLQLIPELGINTNCLETIEGDDTYNRCVERVQFVEVPLPKIVMGQISAMNSVDNISIPSERVLTEQFDRIISVMPFPNPTVGTGFKIRDIDSFGYQKLLPVKRDIGLNKVNEFLNFYRVHHDGGDIGGVNLLYLGIIPGEPDGDVGGEANGIPGRVASWFTYGIDGGSPEPALHYGYNRNLGAHELGHVLGQYHSARENPLFPDHLQGVCGEVGEEKNDSQADEYFPFAGLPIYTVYGDNDNPRVVTIDRPVLGPLGNRDSEVWGLDTRFVGGNNGILLDAINSKLAIINPSQVFSIMSYCASLEVSIERPEAFVRCAIDVVGDSLPRECSVSRGLQGRWMDAFHHERIIEHLKDPINGYVSLAKGSSDTVSSDIFVGSIVLSADGSAIDAEFSPVFSRPMQQRTLESGEYNLELRNSSGTVLRSESFSVYDGQSDLLTSNADSDSQTVAQKVGFAFVVQDPPEYTSFAVTKDGKEISTLALSSNTPSLSVSGPIEGQLFEHDSAINLSWNGADIDNDKLTYSLYYFTDSGSTYRPLLLDTEITTLSFNADKLEGSTQARLGISVSDGTQSTFAETPVFSVVGQAPEIRIESPLARSVFAERQGFLLEATAYDADDGLLPSSSFSWQSDIDGNLGTGEFLVLSASDLTLGVHTITVTATDSDLMTATATVEITITDRNMFPIANNEEVFGGLEETLQIDVLANDTDIEGDFDLSTLTIGRHPRLGIAKVSTTEVGMPVIEYSPITGGEDTFTYYICDGLYRCDSAEVTVVFPDCTITGTRGSDNLVGTSAADVICGLDGDDTIDGKGGNDLIYAGFGEDLVYGRTGDDTIYGGPGNDVILGHRGDDTIYGGLSDDKIWGGGGDDTIYGGEETDELYGEADNDILYGNGGPDKIHGGRGSDTIFGGTGDDSIRGNTGADTISSGSGNDILLGIDPEDKVID